MLCIFGRISHHHIIVNLFFFVSYDIINFFLFFFFSFFSFLKNEKEYRPNAHPSGKGFFPEFLT